MIYLNYTNFCPFCAHLGAPRGPLGKERPSTGPFTCKVKASWFRFNQIYFYQGLKAFSKAFVINVRRGVSQGVEDGCRLPALQVGNPCGQAIPETTIRLFQVWWEKVSCKKKVLFLGVEGKLILTKLWRKTFISLPFLPFYALGVGGLWAGGLWAGGLGVAWPGLSISDQYRCPFVH
jgi:hypothetical protein